MKGIEWAAWANEQAFIGAIFIFIGAVMAVSLQFGSWYFGAYALGASLIMLFFEYPRGQKKSSVTPRRLQQTPSAFLNKLGVLSRNYYVRFVLLLLLSAPCCAIIATVIGGLSVAIASFIYLRAAVKGEKWEPIKVRSDEKRPELLRIPSLPPPRLDQNELGAQPIVHYRSANQYPLAPVPPPVHPKYTGGYVDVESEFNAPPPVRPRPPVPPPTKY